MLRNNRYCSCFTHSLNHTGKYNYFKKIISLRYKLNHAFNACVYIKLFAMSVQKANVRNRTLRGAQLSTAFHYLNELNAFLC